MFTGLVAELGTVKTLKKDKNSYHLTISAKKLPLLLKIGESIAVNGSCLTVVEVSNNDFTADVMPETVRLTVINTFKAGDRVNLERTLRLADGLDGHLVSGHIEGVGTISKIAAEGIAKVTTISTPTALLKYILPKGSIAIDGISLTVTDVTKTGFSVSLIPHTVSETTMGFKKVGDKVNLETDMIGKYVERMLNNKNMGTLTKRSLLENGFI
jgi:riboflavin synthase